MGFAPLRMIARSAVYIAAVLFLHACDSVTYGRIELQSPSLSKECIAQAERYLTDGDQLIVAPSGIGDNEGARLEVLRGRYSVGGMLETTSVRVLRLSFQELGRVDKQVERARFQLLEDTSIAVISACQSAQDVRSTRSCKGRTCDAWIAAHASSR